MELLDLNKKKNIKYNFFFIKLPTLLTIILPLLLISGPFLPDLSVSMCAIIFVINSFYRPLDRYYKSNFFIIFILFYSFLVFSSLMSSEIFFSLKTSVPYIRFGLFALSTWFLINNNTKFLIFLFYSFLICYLILIVDGYIQFFTGENLLGYQIIGDRISSFFKDELILGSYLSRLFPVMFGLFVYFKKINQNKLFYFTIVFIFILTELLIFLSGERSALLFINLSFFFTIILLDKFKTTRLVILISSLLLFIIISLFEPKYKVRIIDQTLIELGLKDNKIFVFSYVHENHFKSALKMFNESRIYGKGPRFFKKSCNKPEYRTSEDSCSSHPHNTYIQLLAETGLLGFLIVFSLFLLLIYNSIKYFLLKKFSNTIVFSDLQILILSAFLITLWPLVPSGNFFNNWLNIIYYLPIGIFLHTIDNNNLNSKI
jgi:O-antigen ligase